MFRLLAAVGVCVLSKKMRSGTGLSQHLAAPVGATMGRPDLCCAVVIDRRTRIDPAKARWDCLRRVCWAGEVPVVDGSIVESRSGEMPIAAAC